MTDMNFNAPGGNFDAPGGVGGQSGGFGGNQPVSKTKWIVQLVVSVLCGFNLIVLVMAIIGLVKADTDLPLANKLYKWGWIVFAICWVLYILLWVFLLMTGAFTTTFETY
ncbi:hypothetical protein [Brachybacterium fresconis]|uniref:Cardiolipin synthase N-terminal domain-containing protein n=1 Tax=Brachybacterium fresconis TaxID=173363 RepID=A0ABS4YP40_9MICO|nr:hypothetical protein [Brachybacterium fresconis]MBP2410557.1 hypothetical protein [Brachybacterium fresconis]